MASSKEYDIMFGSFTERDVDDLFKNKTSDLTFVWQERVPPKRCALYGNNLVVQEPVAPHHQGGYTPGVLSPKYPPNPPTSPVEGYCDVTNRGGLASKLNVNAMPFVPGAPVSVIIPVPKNSFNVTKNSTTSQLKFSSSSIAGALPSNSIASSNAPDASTSGEIPQQPLPGFVVQTLGEPSCNQALDSNSRVDESHSHSQNQDTSSTAQHVSDNARNTIDNHTQSEEPLTRTPVDLSTTQPLTDAQRTQPCSAPDVRSVSPSCSVGSEVERQHEVVVTPTDGEEQAPPTSSTHSGSRSQTHSPTPPQVSHTPSSPSHTITPSQMDSSPLTSVEVVKPEVPSSQIVHTNQSSSQSASPGSVSSLSTTSAASTVPSATGSSTGGSGGVKVMSWASIVGKKSNQPPGQVTQTGLTSSPQVQSGHGSLATKRGCGGEGLSSCDPTVHVTMVTDGGTQDEQSPPLNSSKCHAQLSNLGNQLLLWKINHTPISILPRGLINQGNWCYMHAPLQALLSCPAVYNLLRPFSPFPVLSRDPSPTPVTNTIVQFMHEFKPYPKVESLPQLSSTAATKKKRPSARPELHHGEPFRPIYVYEMLTKISSTLSTKGRQEDAEEFLGCVLDKLHEEMIAAKRAVSDVGKEGGEATPIDGGKEAESKSVGTEDDAVSGEVKGDDEWEQVGPKNKSTITRQTSFLVSPITEIFGGELRSAVHRQGAKESAIVEPFFSLQLDIQSESIWTIKDALESLAVKETVRMSETDAHKRITIAHLPPILILHLKRFVFNLTGGSQKLQKHIQYGIDLEVGKELLSPLIRNKLSTSQRSYKLWAVVYHHGKSATGGHYTADVYHPACGGWVRADDSLIRSIPEDFVLKPGGSAGVNKVAYLLIYRRRDTIM